MSWEKVKLGNVCIKIGSGATPKGGSTIYIENGTTFIRSQNVYNLRFDYSGLVHINDSAAQKLKGVAIQENDVLLNITGDSVARTCIVPKTILPARVNQHVAIIRPDKNKLNPHFLNFYLASPLMQKYMLGLAVGKGASRNAMTKEMISNFEVPCPDIEIQERIAGVLKAYDDLIENNQKQIRLLEEAARRLYKEWLVDLRFPGYETVNIIDGVPEGWKEEKISQIVEYHDKKRKPLSSIKRANFQGEYRYYGAAEVLDHVKNYLFDGIYLLLGEDGTVMTSDGYPVLQYVDGKFWVNNHAHVLTGKAPYSTEFIYLMFMHTTISDVVTGATQLKISQERLSAKKVLIPSEGIVLKFDAIVKKYLERSLSLQHQNVALAEARDRLLPKLMSGEIEV